METTFLKEKEIWGEEALEVMKAYGTKVAPSDLAVLLGAWVTGDDARTSEGERTCLAWSASSRYNYARVVFLRGEDYYEPRLRRVAARPALPSSETSGIRPHSVRTVKLENGKSVQIAEWGEYPQTVVTKKISKTLDKELSSGRLKETGKKYTFDSAGLDAYNDEFSPRECLEYELGGKKYIHVVGKKADDDSILSSGEKVENGKGYWVEVEPVEWLKDETGIWVAKKALFAGVQFDTKEEYEGDFSNTAMKKYLDTYFSVEVYCLEEEKDKVKQQIESLASEQLATLNERDPELLQKIIIAGQLVSVFERLPYEKQMPLYKSTRDKMQPDEKKAIENIIRAARQNQGK